MSLPIFGTIADRACAGNYERFFNIETVGPEDNFASIGIVVFAQDTRRLVSKPQPKISMKPSQALHQSQARCRGALANELLIERHQYICIYIYIFMYLCAESERRARGAGGHTGYEFDIRYSVIRSALEIPRDDLRMLRKEFGRRPALQPDQADL